MIMSSFQMNGHMLAMHNESGWQYYEEEIISFHVYVKSPEYKVHMWQARRRNVVFCDKTDLIIIVQYITACISMNHRLTI